MKRRLGRWMMTGMLIVGCSAPAAMAQVPPPEGPPPGDPEELREAMREYFEKRLRSDLSLSDEQVEQILPLVQQLEQEKRAARRTRMETARTLRRGMEQGATDAELRDALDLLEQIERNEQELRRSTMGEIDKVLSVRQQVQIRFFMQRFQREMQHKIREIRGDPEGPRRGRFRQDRGPRGNRR